MLGLLLHDVQGHVRELMAKNGGDWTYHASEAIIDSWVALTDWQRDGEKMFEVSGKHEAWLLKRSRPKTSTMRAKRLRHESCAMHFSEPENWAVITRHRAVRSVPILNDFHPSPYSSPVLAFANQYPRRDRRWPYPA